MHIFVVLAWGRALGPIFMRFVATRLLELCLLTPLKTIRSSESHFLVIYIEVLAVSWFQGKWSFYSSFHFHFWVIIEEGEIYICVVRLELKISANKLYGGQNCD